MVRSPLTELGPTLERSGKSIARILGWTDDLIRITRLLFLHMSSLGTMGVLKQAVLFGLLLDEG